MNAKMTAKVTISLDLSPEEIIKLGVTLHTCLMAANPENPDGGLISCLNELLKGCGLASVTSDFGGVRIEGEKLLPVCGLFTITMRDAKMTHYLKKAVEAERDIGPIGPVSGTCGCPTGPKGEAGPHVTHAVDVGAAPAEEALQVTKLKSQLGERQYAADHPRGELYPLCAICGKKATCYGHYLDHVPGYACDACCGHGGEDGHCQKISGNPEPFTPEEWQAVSLCIGWVVALSQGHTEDAQGRREWAHKAMEAMRRAFGPGFHSRITEAVNPPNGTYE